MTTFLSTKLGKALGGICILFVAAGAWLFVSDARHRAIINSGKNNIHAIWHGLEVYNDAKGQVPPAITRDADGNPLSSWRFPLLPYMESTKRRSDFESAWDSPVNSSTRELRVLSFDVGGFVRGQWGGEPLRMSAIH